ncbi:MAG: leucine-rich repeat protein, partial [Salinivirgaceae bacterium]|nr:leucine-rich repeat protein [Salinivirgaceae bacterium]
EDGNMCNDGRPAPYNLDWPGIGNQVYKEEFKKGTPPYLEGKLFFNSKLFSYDELHLPDIPNDVVIDSILYITEGVPIVDSHKNQTDFTKVEIPESVELIKGSALYGTKVEEIELPSSVREIGSLAFHSCAELESVTIPDGVKEIGDAAFQNCTSLASAEIGSGLRQLNFRLFKGSGLTEIAIPANVKAIGKECFQDCAKLKKVTIANGVRKIDNSAFKNTAVEEIEIPASVTEIGTGITPKNTVWIVEKDSYAHKYAVENNQTFRLKSGENTDNNENEGNNTETSVTEQFAHVNIYAHGRTLVVENATDEIRVYDVMGRLVCRDEACRVRTEIPMEKSGVYVVKIGNMAKRVIVE